VGSVFANQNPRNYCLKVSKKIFESNALKQIIDVDSQIRDYLGRYSIVNAMMKPGIYLVPIDYVQQVEQFIQSKSETRDYWVFQIGEEYESVKLEFSEKLDRSTMNQTTHR
jgi:hypothetical protein